MSRRLVGICTLGVLTSLCDTEALEGPSRSLPLDPGPDATFWSCTNGAEFPGAQARLRSAAGGTLALDYDFSAGGSYVAAIRGRILPVEATGVSYTLQASEPCTVFCRIQSGGRTYQGFSSRVEAGTNTPVQIDFAGPWTSSWGPGQEGTPPRRPIEALWMCIDKGKDLPLIGTLTLGDLKATSSGALEDLRQVPVLPDAAFESGGWRVEASWLPEWTILDLRCTRRGGGPATLALAFPWMGRDRVTRYRLSAEQAETHFLYMPPLPNGGNPRNTYALSLELSSALGQHRETLRLVGRDADSVNLGFPRTGGPLPLAILGTNAHFAYGEGSGAFTVWKDYRALVDAMAAAGMAWVRDSLRTETDVEGRLRVRSYDMDWARYASSQGIAVIAIIDMTADEPQEQFVRRCQAIVEQTRGLVNVFELGNEPNNFGGWIKTYGGTWNGKEPDNSTSPWVKAHLAYTNAGAEAIKALRPEVTVIGLGACAPTNFRYLELGVTQALDGVVEHPYAYSLPAEKVPFGLALEERDGVKVGDRDFTFAGLINSYTEAFRASGKMRSLWLTEFGWTCFWFDEKGNSGLYGGFSEQTQAIYLVRRFIECLTLPVAAACQYDFIDDYGGAQFDAEANFGLLRADLSPKPSYQAVQRLASLFAGLEVDDQVSVVVQKDPLHRSMTRSELVRNWDEVGISAATGLGAFPFRDPAHPGERLVALWSKLPVSGEFNNRFVELRIKGWQGFRADPLAIDLITGTSFDMIFTPDGDDTLVEVILSDHPLLIKAFADAAP